MLCAAAAIRWKFVPQNVQRLHSNGEIHLSSPLTLVVLYTTLLTYHLRNLTTSLYLGRPARLSTVLYVQGRLQVEVEDGPDVPVWENNVTCELSIFFVVSFRLFI
jgi:hypothetical protein